jgi:tRNA(fMet)-specific endonuclease VapC
MENILVDTDVVIGYLRAKDKSNTLPIELMTKFEVYMTSITEFELFLGAKTEQHIKDLELLLDIIKIIPFGYGCGRKAALIWNELQNKHQHLEIKDIFIASIAIQNNLLLSTINKKHFEGIKKIRLYSD